MRPKLVLRILLFGAVIALAACSGEAGPEGPAGPPGPAGPQGPAGEAATVDIMADLTCSECHNETTLLSGKTTAWADSAHGSGGAYVRGTRSSCAGCHSGGGFTAMLAAGQNPGSVEAGDPNPTRQDCRACHQIHQSYTGADWALTTEAAVDFYAIPGTTYDGGSGNLCATCHQPRRVIADAVDGFIEITSTHWGPHHGGQGSMLLGVAGAGGVEGSPSSHYSMIEGTCVTCHLGETGSHTFEPDISACTGCHADAESFDINGVQTEVKAMLDELEAGLIALGWLDDEGHPTVAQVPEAQAAALWNWIYIAHEDGSYGVHNPAYTKALLEAGLAALGG